jgi:hypothetical protein
LRAFERSAAVDDSPRIVQMLAKDDDRRRK